MTTVIYLISDTHFDHTNIIRYCGRPFADAAQMNEVMIARWIDRVTPEDIVVHLGDVSLASKEKTTGFMNRLPGRKLLIRGNHDERRSPAWWLDVGFRDVSQYPVLIGERLILSHEPLDMEQGVPVLKGLNGGSFTVRQSLAPEEMRGLINIHGHIHEKPSPTSRHMNISVEQTEYAPISLEKILGLVSVV